MENILLSKTKLLTLFAGNYGNTMDGKNESVVPPCESEEEEEEEDEEEEKPPSEPEWNSTTDSVKPVTRDRWVILRWYLISVLGNCKPRIFKSL